MLSLSFLGPLFVAAALAGSVEPSGLEVAVLGLTVVTSVSVLVLVPLAQPLVPPRARVSATTSADTASPGLEKGLRPSP